MVVYTKHGVYKAWCIHTKHCVYKGVYEGVYKGVYKAQWEDFIDTSDNLGSSAELVKLESKKLNYKTPKIKADLCLLVYKSIPQLRV